MTDGAGQCLRRGKAHVLIPIKRAGQLEGFSNASLLEQGAEIPRSALPDVRIGGFGQHSH